MSIVNECNRVMCSEDSTASVSHYSDITGISKYRW